MAWVPYNEQTVVGYTISKADGVQADPNGEMYFYDTDNHSYWTIVFNQPVKVRVTNNYYKAAANRFGSIYTPASMWVWGPDVDERYVNTAPPYPATNLPDMDGVLAFEPGLIESNDPVIEVGYDATYTTSDHMPSDEYYSFIVEIWVEEEPPPPPPPREGFKVYELDKGWSFDGAYIPHFAELNWYFGDDPFTSKSIQKVRIHGLAKGLAQLQLSVAGMQTEYDSDYTEPQFINLPRNAAHVSSEYFPATNYVDSSNWGMSLQLKFEGSNRDLNKPEPSHVLQVLALQGSPQDVGKRNN